MVGPSFAGSSSSKYITSTVTTGTVSATSVATGTIAASTVYGLKFGDHAGYRQPRRRARLRARAARRAAPAAATGSLTWPVKTVSVTVGQTVKKGDALADRGRLRRAAGQLTSAQATLAIGPVQARDRPGRPELADQVPGREPAQAVTEQLQPGRRQPEDHQPAERPDPEPGQGGGDRAPRQAHRRHHGQGSGRRDRRPTTAPWRRPSPTWPRPSSRSTSPTSRPPSRSPALRCS